MFLRRKRKAWAWGLSLVALLVGLISQPSAMAGRLTVSPMQVKLPPDGDTAVLSVTNAGAAEILVQVEGFDWLNGADLQSLTSTNELIFVPAVFEVAPGQSQVLRIALRKPSQTTSEETYRLVIREVPTGLVTGPGNVGFAVSVSLPVFVSPERVAPEPVWFMRERTEGRPELVLANRGTAHIRVHGLQIAAVGELEPLVSIAEAAYVLAGEERSWPLDLKASALDGPFTVKAETRLGTLEAPVALEGN